MNLRRAEAVNVDLWEGALDVVEKLFVPLQLIFRMQPALHQDLIAPEVDGFPDLLQELHTVEHIAFGMLWWPIKRTKVANGRADIRVVDIPVDVVGAVRLGMQPV